MIYLTGSSKGGAGKSTLAANLTAVLASLLGRDVLLVDTDKKQPSASLWARLREKSGMAPVTCVTIEAPDIVREVRRQVRKYDDIVIDAGGHDSAELRAAMLAADVVLMPAAPALFDIAALSTDNALVATAREFNPALRAFLVINNASTHARETGTRDMRAQLPMLAPEYVVLDAMLRRRGAYDLCKLEGIGVVERPGGKAHAEMKAVFAELTARLA